jgi:hypothetical protein
VYVPPKSLILLLVASATAIARGSVQGFVFVHELESLPVGDAYAIIVSATHAPPSKSHSSLAHSECAEHARQAP